MTLKEALIELLRDKFEFNIRIGKIIAGTVSAGFCDVTPIDSEDENGNGSTLKKVRIQANPGNGISIVPSDGSLVIIAEIAPFDYCIILYSSISSITLLDGSQGGLTKTPTLFNKIHVMEQKINALIAFTGSGTPIAPLTVQSDIENTNIRHGNP